MKTIAKANVEMVALLAKVIETRKVLVKQEEELKEQVRGIMGLERTLEAGAYMVVITDTVRTDLDRTELTKFLGPKIESFLKTTNVSKMTIVPKEGI